MFLSTFLQGTLCKVEKALHLMWCFYFCFAVVMTPLLSWGTATLDQALDGLEWVMTEFIPYVVHIGLWIIVATLGFVAIRWLVNWVRAKIFDTF